MYDAVGLDVSQKTTVLCVVDGGGHLLLARGMHLIARSDLRAVLQHAGVVAPERPDTVRVFRELR